MTLLGMIGLDLDTNPANLFSTVTSGASIVAGAGRSSGNALHASTSGGAGGTVNLTASQATLAAAMAIDAVGAIGTVNIFNFLDNGTSQVTIRLNLDGSVSALRGATVLGSSSPGAVAYGIYQHVEALVTINNTTGAVQVWVNFVSVLNLTGQNTRQSANNSANQIAFSPGESGSNGCDITYGTTQAGDLRVECVLPNGAGTHTQFTPSAGSNWQNVDEVPPNDDTTHNDSSTAGQLDTFVHAALAGIPSSITAVAVQVRGRNTTTGSASMAPVLRSGTTDSVGTTVSQNTTYGDFQSIYLTDPNTGSAWANAAAVNATEIGYKKIT